MARPNLAWDPIKKLIVSIRDIRAGIVTHYEAYIGCVWRESYRLRTKCSRPRRCTWVYDTWSECHTPCNTHNQVDISMALIESLFFSTSQTVLGHAPVNAVSTPAPHEQAHSHIVDIHTPSLHTPTHTHTYAHTYTHLRPGP